MSYERVSDGLIFLVRISVVRSGTKINVYT